MAPKALPAKGQIADNAALPRLMMLADAAGSFGMNNGWLWLINAGHGGGQGAGARAEDRERERGTIAAKTGKYLWKQC